MPARMSRARGGGTRKERPKSAWFREGRAVKGCAGPPYMLFTKSEDILF